MVESSEAYYARDVARRIARAPAADDETDNSVAIRRNAKMRNENSERATHRLDGARRDDAVPDLTIVATGSDDTSLRDLAQRKLSDLRDGGAGAAVVPTQRVYVQYIDPADADDVKAIIAALAPTHPEIERTPQLVTEADTGFVRYFFDADKESATMRSRRRWEGLLVAMGMPLALAPQRLSADAFPKARRGLLEVWFQPLRRRVEQAKSARRSAHLYDGPDGVVPNDAAHTEAL